MGKPNCDENVKSGKTIDMMKPMSLKPKSDYEKLWNQGDETKEL